MLLHKKIDVYVLRYYRITTFLQTTRNMKCQSSISNSTCTKLTFSKYGNPIDVVELKQEQIRSPAATEVLVNMILAPVHEGDLNTIQNRMPFIVDFPSIPGMEGIGVIEKVGSNVNTFVPGDRVTIHLGTIGSWCTHRIFPANELIKIRSDTDINEQAVMANPSTAYRLLKDFVNLKPGDTIIQNGSNGCVGRYIIQLCKMWSINTINVVRDRPNIDNLKESLLELGATHVITEKEIRNFKQNYTEKPVLALNCVGGSTAKALFSLLPMRTLYVTYGSVTGQPVPVNMSAIAFKDITFKGFWLKHWHDEHTSNEISNMLDEITEYIKKRKLTTPPYYQYIPLKDYRKAFESSLKPPTFVGNKYIFDMRMQ